MKGITALVVFITIILSACSPNPENIQATVQAAVDQTHAAQPIILPTSTLKPTPMDTSTPAPTATPKPTATLAFAKWNSSQVVDAFVAAELEITQARPASKDDYGAAPMIAIEGTHFLIPSICSDCGGRIFSFSSQPDLEIMKAYYEKLAKSSALYFSWVFVNDNILVQINGDLPETMANKYRDALTQMK